MQQCQDSPHIRFISGLLTLSNEVSEDFRSFIIYGNKDDLKNVLAVKYLQEQKQQQIILSILNADLMVEILSYITDLQDVLNLRVVAKFLYVEFKDDFRAFDRMVKYIEDEQIAQKIGEISNTL